jgi:hypothetical protein
VTAKRELNEETKKRLSRDEHLDENIKQKEEKKSKEL